MNILMKSTLVAALAVSAATGVAIADGHADKALKAAIKARQANMQVIAYHTGILGGIAKGEIAYDAAMATAAAENLHAAAAMHRGLLWTEGSAQGSVEGTRADPKIWSDAAGFEEKAMALETAAEAMIAAAGQDQAAVGAAMAGIGGSCKGCHDNYRGPEN